MKLIIGRRCSGKTINLVKESAKTGAIIIANTIQSRNIMLGYASDMGIAIPKPMLITDNFRGFNTDQHFLIDEPSYLISKFLCHKGINIDNIDAVTIGQEKISSIEFLPKLGDAIS